jgi:hypothetical protein
MWKKQYAASESTSPPAKQTQEAKPPESCPDRDARAPARDSLYPDMSIPLGKRKLQEDDAAATSKQS